MGIIVQLDLIMSRGYCGSCYCGSNIHLVNLRYKIISDFPL
jgi:hypothetical protein